MATKRAILVIEYEENDNGYETAGEIAMMTAGCIEDMEASSFPELSVVGYGSISELQADFDNKTGIFSGEGTFLPSVSEPTVGRRA